MVYQLKHLIIPRYIASLMYVLIKHNIQPSEIALRSVLFSKSCIHTHPIYAVSFCVSFKQINIFRLSISRRWNSPKTQGLLESLLLFLFVDFSFDLCIINSNHHATPSFSSPSYFSVSFNPLSLPPPLTPPSFSLTFSLPPSSIPCSLSLSLLPLSTYLCVFTNLFLITTIHKLIPIEIQWNSYSKSPHGPNFCTTTHKSIFFIL